MIGFWCILTWEQLGRPNKMNLVELGPGRGTLMSDILRTAKQLRDKSFYEAIQSIQFVEVSPTLKAVQASTLGVSQDSITQNTDKTVPSLIDSRIKVQWRNLIAEVKLDGNSPIT